MKLRTGKEVRLAFGLLLGVLVLALGSSQQTKADTVFSISGGDYTSCAGPYAVASTTTCNATYAISGEMTTSLSLSTIEADAVAGGGSYAIPVADITSFSLTDSSDSITLANALNFGTEPPYAVISATSTGITGWDFILFDDSHLTYNAGDGGYDGNTVGLQSTFGVASDLTYIGTGCTALGTASGACTNIVLAGSAPSTFSELTVSSTAVPEPGTLLLLGTGLLGLVGTFKRKFFS